MKRYSLLLASICAVMLVFSGCAGDKNTSTTQKNFQVENVIQQSFENELTSETVSLLWDGLDSVSINVYDGKVSITARVTSSSNTPKFAELFCPIAVEAIEKENCEIRYIDIQSYDDTADDGTLVNWNTRDGVTGTFLIESENVIKPNSDIAYLKNYYGDITKLEEASLQYQGEWQCQERESKRLIASGTSINFVSEGKIVDKPYRDVYSFELGFDESGNIVVCGDVGNPCYNIKLEDNTLYIEGVSDNGIETYIKISNNTEIPKEMAAPAIGMTEDEVLASTWGSPTKRNKTTTDAHIREQWVYDDGYIYFTDGVVTSIQEK